MSGRRGLPVVALRRAAAVLLAALVVAFYLVGPTVVPRLHHAAATTCNKRVAGDYRSYRLSWQLGPRPHWRCWDLRHPAKPAADLGWWAGGR